MRKILLTFWGIFIANVCMAQSVHTLQRGETLESVAKKYGVTISALKQANPQASKYTYVGVKLNIPVVKSSTSEEKEKKLIEQNQTSSNQIVTAKKETTKLQGAASKKVASQSKTMVTKKQENTQSINSNVETTSDYIILKNGEEINAIVEKVGVSEIDYRKTDNETGPLYSVSKNEVFMIKYKNGTKDVFGEQETSGNNSNQSTANGIIEKQPADNNSELISNYQKKYTMGSAYSLKSKAKVSRVLVTWGVAKSSILSNEDIEISFQPASFWFHYNVVIYNKTKHPIYI